MNDNNSQVRSILFILAVATLITLGFVAYANQADACQEGKPCEKPLPTNDGKNGGPVACNVPGNGQGPVHKCPTATPTLAPTVVVTVVAPTSTPIPATATPTKSETQPVEVVVTEEPTTEVTATAIVTETVSTVGFPPATACGDASVCDPCDLLLQALEQGLVVVITDKENVTMIQNGQLFLNGETLATGKLGQDEVVDAQ